MLLSGTGQADIMASMFIASMAQQQKLTKMLLGKLYENTPRSWMAFFFLMGNCRKHDDINICSYIHVICLLSDAVGLECAPAGMA